MIDLDMSISINCGLGLSFIRGNDPLGINLQQSFEKLLRRKPEPSFHVSLTVCHRWSLFPPPTTVCESEKVSFKKLTYIR